MKDASYIASFLQIAADGLFRAILINLAITHSLRVVSNGPVFDLLGQLRYLSAGVGIIANALFINYAGLYILILLLAPRGYVITVFEERELIDHFGEECRKYQREVPRSFLAGEGGKSNKNDAYLTSRL